MATQEGTALYILETLDLPDVFSTRKMFGEYALYANKKVVGLICNDLLYVKIRPESESLKDICETDTPYPGAHLYYVISEEQIRDIENLDQILIDISKNIPLKKKVLSKKKKND